MYHHELKKILWLGYSKSSVQEVFSNLKLENQRLTEQVDKQSHMIEALKEKLARYENKDVLISEVLVEAKHVAKNMIKGAHEEVETLRQDSEKEISDKLAGFNQSIAALNAIKQDIVQQEMLLRNELKAIIKKYLNYVETIDLSSFKNLDEGINRSFHVVASGQHNHDDIKEEIPKHKVLELHPKTKENNDIKMIDQGGEIPTYDFGAMIQ